jgi:hypothetical protein
VLLRGVRHDLVLSVLKDTLAGFCPVGGDQQLLSMVDNALGGVVQELIDLHGFTGASVRLSSSWPYCSHGVVSPVKAAGVCDDGRYELTI